LPALALPNITSTLTLFIIDSSITEGGRSFATQHSTLYIIHKLLYTSNM